MTAYERFARYLLELIGSDEHRKIEVSGYMPLSLEWIAEDQISICHYGEQNGDLMRDPDIVFELANGRTTAEPLSFRNDYMGLYQEVYDYAEDDGRKIRVRPKLKADLRAFASQWFSNLRQQGFFDAAAAMNRKAANS